MKKQPHQALSLEKKLQVLEERNRSGLSKTQVAKNFNIPKSTLSQILKNKAIIENAIKNGTFTLKQMWMQPMPYEELEKVHFLCFKRAQSANFLISRPILRLQEIPELEGVGNDDENDPQQEFKISP